MSSSERIDDLQIKGFKLIQNPNGFCFGVDAVLLSDFAKIKKGEDVMDLCCGNGIIPVLIAAKYQPDTISGLEIQPYAADLASRNMVLNEIDDYTEMLCGDLKQAEEYYEGQSFDVITCNPPYKKSDSGIESKDDTNRLARHEVACTLEDVISAVYYLLKDNGRFYMIHRPDRLADIFTLMRKYRIEPKSYRFVHPAPSKTANMVLVEGLKYGGSFLKLLPPLYVRDENGEYTEEINTIYGRN